jgi:hypothetical protein
MIQRKRIRALARTSVAVFIAAALGACSASTYPAPTAQSPVSSTRQSDAADSGSVLPEVVVTASRLSSPRVAADTWARPPARRRGG